MLNKLKQEYKLLQDTKKLNKEECLCSAFMMCSPQEIEKENWQLDLYNKTTNTISSFKRVNEEMQRINKDAEIFKEQHTTVQELKLDEVKVELQQAKEWGELELYAKHEDASKIIIILQQEEQPLWNLTFLTTMFNLLNIRINAVTGEVEDKKYTSLLTFNKEFQ